MNNQSSLDDKHILVTRPEGLAEQLCEDIKKHGGIASSFPVIEIVAPENTDSLNRAVKTINDHDIALFISPSAVTESSKYMPLSTIETTVGVIGTATLKALEDKNVTVDIIPDGHNSESLLLHPQLQQKNITGKRILIFKGEGGLTLLGDTLKTRGAEVYDACMYRRKKPGNYKPLTASDLNTIDAVLVGSGESLKNLISMTEDIPALLDKHIIVPGERCAAIATELGFSKITTSENATNRSFLNTLLHS